MRVSPGSRIIRCAVLALCTVACTGRDAGELIPLRIGTTQWPGFDIMHHASKERLFERRGLSVQWMFFDNQQDSTRAVMLGSLDAAFSSVWDTIQIDPGNDSPAIILITNVSHGADGIVARPGIASMANLRGKRVATKLGTINQLILLEALTLHGMTPEDIEIVDIDNETAERRIYEGSIDAAVTWEPAMSRITAKIGGAIVYTTREVGSQVVDCLVTGRKVLDHKREAMIRLLLVWLDVMHDLETRPDQVYANAGAGIGVDAETFARSYAGLERGDRDLNERMFGQGRLLRTIEAHDQILRAHPFGHRVRGDAISDAEILAAALARWRPLTSSTAPAPE
jgi:NitT/TauT family transport system substrate-binding protein